MLLNFLIGLDNKARKLGQLATNGFGREGDHVMGSEFAPCGRETSSSLARDRNTEDCGANHGSFARDRSPPRS